MFLTNLLFSTAKSKIVMVVLQSTASKHRIVTFRDRVADKKQILYFDPLVELECVYKEVRKIRTVKRNLNVSVDRNEHRYGIIPKEG